MQEQEISGNQQVFHLPFENYEYFMLDSTTSDWTKEISDELNDFDPDDQEYITKKTEIQFNLQIKKDEHPTYKEYVILKGDLEGSYYTPCIKCLMPALKSFKTTINECFLDSSLESSPELEDADSIFIEGQEFDICYIEDKIIPIKQTIWEQIVISLDPYPVHSKECKGLCIHCGTNLNIDSCKHHKN